MMANLSGRSYAGDRDLDAIAHLINTCEEVDRLDQGTSISELQQEFNEPSLDVARDICLWEDAEGKLIGFAQLSVSEPGEVIDGWLSFRVHPDARSRRRGSSDDGLGRNADARGGIMAGRAREAAILGSR